MKKINNKNTVYLYTGMLIILMVFLIFSGIVMFLLKLLPSYLLFSGLCIVVSVIIFYSFLRVKIFEYENSMQFISIKQDYFWKLNRLISPIEFPNDKLVGFSVRKILFVTTLMLVIKSKEQKTKKNRQIFELKQSLQNAKEYDEN